VDSGGEMLSNLYGYVPPADYLAWLRTAVVLGRYPGAVLGKSEEAAEYRHVGDAFARISHDGRAIEMYDKALALSERKKQGEETRRFKAETLASKGFSHYKNSDPIDKVEAASKTLLEMDPDGKLQVRDNGLFLKALAEATAGRGAEAAAAVDEALAKHPKSDVRDGLLYIKAYWVLSQGDRAGARKLYQEILDAHPESHFRLGAEDALKSLR
jgi:tetratricopeptide (TPR) repeat protein